MATLADADAPLASGAPALAVAEPSLLLLALAAGTLAAVVGDTDPFDASGLCPRVILSGVESGVGGDQPGYASQLGCVYLDRGDQQIRVMRSLRIHFVVNDDLVLRLLQL